MSNLNVRTVTGKDGQPVSFPTGISIGAGAAGAPNNIGMMGQLAFGVGICPALLPAGMVELSGTRDSASDNYGNYQFSDGSIMVWVPAFYYKFGTASNGLALNDIDIKSFDAYTSVASANAAGYALHRAFYDAGAVQPGVFIDKYQCSNNAGIASSIKNGNPLSSNVVHNSFSGLTGAPANAYHGALVAAKTRGTSFFCNSRFIFSALAMLAYAHGRAATATTWCAWYDAAGITNFPKGNNNNALGDVNDAAIKYISDGYPNAGKTGSANLFSRTTHNGQNNGVCDLNGNMWEINIGITSNVTDVFILNTSASMKSLTGGNTLATDAWGATGLAANYTNMGATVESIGGTSTLKKFGNATQQVLSHATTGNAWLTAGTGIPLLLGTGGTNAFGQDGLWDYKPNELCPIAGGYWGDAANAGAWAVHLATARGSSSDSVGFRSALYL